MSRLFIALYLDEDVDVLVAELIRAYGFDVLTTRDAGLLGEDDEAQLAYAASEGRAMLTHNRADFERLAREYFASGKEHHGIIFAVRRPPQEMLRRLLLILNHLTADELQNQVRYM
jgi:uncharacterized protein with PIN domain